MAGRYWSVAVEGFEPFDTRELTLLEVEYVEKATGVPWVLMNPHASMRVAIGLVAVAARRQGMADDAAVTYAEQLKVERLHRAFVFHPGEAPDEPEGEGDPPPSAPTSASG